MDAYALLVVYCLRHAIYVQKDVVDDLHFILSADAAAQIIAVLFTIAIHLWKKSMMWSIAAGTICYMILIRTI